MMIIFKQNSFQNVLGFATDISVDKLNQLVNDQRQKNNLPPLTINSALTVAAQKKASVMFQDNCWAHYCNGTTPWDFILGAGYKYEYAGENLAKNFLFSNGVIDAWMNSPTHRENVLNSNYTDVGYAIVNGTLNGESTTLVVQEFGKPLAGSFAPPPVQAKEITNTAPSVPAVQPQVATAPQAQQILTQKTFQPKVNAFNFTFNLNVVFMVFLLTALALDFYFAAKLNIVRVGGKNTAHFLFIIFVLVGLFMSTIGTIV